MIMWSGLPRATMPWNGSPGWGALPSFVRSLPISSPIPLPPNWVLRWALMWTTSSLPSLPFSCWAACARHGALSTASASTLIGPSSAKCYSLGERYSWLDCRSSWSISRSLCSNSTPFTITCTCPPLLGWPRRPVCRWPNKVVSSWTTSMHPSPRRSTTANGR